MKKRSEIVKKRSEVSAPAKASGSVTCGACEATIERSAIKTYRDDGTGECPECGDALVVSDAKHDIPSKALAVDSDRDDTKRDGPLNPERKWCGTCGSEWPIVHGQFMINCGHMHASRVDDPRKATNFGPPAPLNVRVEHERAKRDAEDERNAKSDFGKTMHDANEHAKEHGSGAKKDSRDLSTLNATSPAPKITIEGNRLSVEWGKSTFPVGMMMNFTVGGFFASVEHEPGERLKAFRQILGDFEKMANEAFAKQSAWYQEKLGSLK